MKKKKQKIPTSHKKRFVIHNFDSYSAFYCYYFIYKCVVFFFWVLGDFCRVRFCSPFGVCVCFVCFYLSYLKMFFSFFFSGG